MEIMKKFINWVKANKLTTLLLIAVIYLIFGRNLISLLGVRSLLKTSYSNSRGITNPSIGSVVTDSTMELAAPLGSMSQNYIPPVQSEAAPTTDVEERLVVRETNLSLLVEDVRNVSNEIINFTENQGGYMVSSSLSQPEEAPFGTIVVRIPSDSLLETMEYFRSLSIKVSSEFISGKDVTDQYEDIEARLFTLEKTKSRFEEIMEQAVKIDDILRVQREIISLQSQIDNLKGRQKLLEGTAKLAKVTIYLSTDEIALPYAPSDTFRPNVIFKLAIRSLIKNLRNIAETAIWIVVYAVIWLPVLAIIILIKRWKKKRKSTEPTQA